MCAVNKSKEWFKDWFNSPYYHILYKHRNEAEAEYFIDNLIGHLQLPANAKIEDVGCGKGRHAVYLNKKGFDVTGIDISEESIQYASRFENKTLSFFVQDMRKPFRENYFEAAVNLFTSFGYFRCMEEEIDTLASIKKGLKEKGVLVIDYFNSQKICNESVFEETKKIDGIIFKITKEISNGYASKTIEIDDHGNKKSFYEKVKLFTLDDFRNILTIAGFKLISTFGDYNLNPFDEQESDRLILVAVK